MSNDQSSHSEAIAYAMRALEQSARPLTISGLQKAIPKALKIKNALPDLMRRLVESGSVRSHQARSTTYWLPDLEIKASEKIIEALSELPLTRTDLKNKLRSLLVGWPEKKREEMLEKLMKEKRVFKVAPLAGKASLLSARDKLTPQDYIRLSLQLAVARLKKEGLTPDQVLAIAGEILKQTPEAVVSPQPDVFDQERLIMERMLQINPSVATGAPVELNQLRQSLHSEIADKDIFDQAIMRLVRQGRVAVHQHDYVGSLSQEELAALVSDGRGNYFVGVTLRA